jgi:excisionase family DNA binding protein
VKEQEVPAKLLYDVSEVSALLGASRSKLYQYLLDGRLKSITIGRRRKIPPQAIHDFIERQLEAPDTGFES